MPMKEAGSALGVNPGTTHVLDQLNDGLHLLAEATAIPSLGFPASKKFLLEFTLPANQKASTHSQALSVSVSPGSHVDDPNLERRHAMRKCLRAECTSGCPQPPQTSLVTKYCGGARLDDGAQTEIPCRSYPSSQQGTEDLTTPHFQLHVYPSLSAPTQDVNQIPPAC